jgi:hypothetical protein
MGNVPSNFMDNRAYNAKGINDSDDSVRRAGGEAGNDPRRVDAKIIIERKIKDHDMSGYNHNASGSQPANGGHENEIRYAGMQDRKAMGMGTPHPDGTYSK